MILKRRGKNVFYFYGGAIGGFLLGLHYIDTVVRSRAGKGVRGYVVVPRNKKLYEGLLAKYPYVSVIEYGRNTVFQALIFFLSQSISVNYVVTAPAFTEQPLHVLFAGRILTLLRRRSMFAGFTLRSFWRGVWYTFRLPMEKETSVFHMTDQLSQSMGFGDGVSNPSFRFERLPSVLSDYGLTKNSYIVVHPFPGSQKRTLPLDRWQHIVAALAETYPNHTIVLTGSDADRTAAVSISEYVQKRNVHVLAGKLSLQELCNVLYDAKLYIGVDTGITHLAGMFQKDSVLIENLSNPPWLPYYNTHADILFNKKHCICKGDKSDSCAIIYKGQKYFRCMYEISDQTILESVRIKMNN